MAVGGWVCPKCERRVPAYITVCRCGFSPARSEPQPPAGAAKTGGPASPSRGRAPASPPTPTTSERAAQQGAAIRSAIRRAPRPRRAAVGMARQLSWDFWAAIGVLLVAMIFGILRLAAPTEPLPVLPLLGRMEPDRAPPSQTPGPNPPVAGSVAPSDLE